MEGKLRFIYGPMESAKSALLLIEAHNFEKRGIGVLCMKPSTDNRDGENIIKSRIGLERECFVILPDYNIFQIIKEILVENKSNKIPLQWILVDESQFLTSKQVNQLRQVVDQLGINVLCYGLRTDFQTKLFEASKRLFELADDIDELKIACRCGRKAVVNARYNSLGEIVIDGAQVLIGGEDIYKPLCFKCFRDEIHKTKTNN